LFDFKKRIVNVISYLFVKLDLSKVPPVMWVVIFIVLVFLGIISKIQSFFENKRKEKEEEKRTLIESNWASESGKLFYEKLIQKLRNNESALISNFSELDGISDFTRESISEHFGVADSQFDLRIPLALEYLNSRYLAESEELIGVSEEQAQLNYGVNLTNGEKLFEVFDECEWFELKRNQERTWNYQGLGLKIPLGGGLSYRLGSIQNLNPAVRYEYKSVGQGKLYLTNKRVIFQGESENKVVTLNSLIDIEQYNDCCVIGKSRGKKPIIKFQMDDSALFSRKLSRLFDTV
jgi:hypothetical protein